MPRKLEEKEIDKLMAIRWAKSVLNNGDSIAILDTETTSLNGEVIEIGVVDVRGERLFQSLVRPTVPISESATQVHGLTDKMVNNAPSALEILLPLLQAIGERKVVIYNARFDIEALYRSFKARSLPFWFAALHDEPTEDIFSTRFVNGRALHCAMHNYSRFVGDWNEKHQSYRWQKLPGAGHRALDDARATLRLIERMAEG